MQSLLTRGFISASNQAISGNISRSRDKWLLLITDYGITKSNYDYGNTMASLNPNEIRSLIGR